MRRLRVFQEDGYLSIDYKQQSVELARKVGPAILREELPVNRHPPLDEELAAFLDAAQTGRQPLVTGAHAREALAVALDIEGVMRHASGKVAR